MEVRADHISRADLLDEFLSLALYEIINANTRYNCVCPNARTGCILRSGKSLRRALFARPDRFAAVSGDGWSMPPVANRAKADRAKNGFSIPQGNSPKRPLQRLRRRQGPGSAGRRIAQPMDLDRQII